MKKDNIIKYVKASRKGAREAEIELYGKPILHCNIIRNKKKYTRKLKHKGSSNEDPFLIM